MSESSEPLFSSGVEGPSELLARVRRRLASEDTGTDAGPRDPVLDLAKSDGLSVGWHDPEVIDGQTMRWTQRRFGFEAVAADATLVNLEACLPPESGLAFLVARISADEVPGVPFVIRPGWNSVLVPIPGGLRGHIAFSVDTGGSWCPAGRTGAEDIRELSLLVRRVALVRMVDPSSSRPQPLAPAPAAGLPGRILRKFERVARNLGRVANVFGRMAEMERRLELFEKRLTLLAEIDAQIEVDLALREETLRDDIGRKLKALRRD